MAALQAWDWSLGQVLNSLSPSPQEVHLLSNRHPFCEWGIGVQCARCLAFVILKTTQGGCALPHHLYLWVLTSGVTGVGLSPCCSVAAVDLGELHVHCASLSLCTPLVRTRVGSQPRLGNSQTSILYPVWPPQ